MIRIRHSGKPYEEIELKGSKSELSGLRSVILRFCEAAPPAIDVPAHSEFKASPYQCRLQRIRLCKTTDLLLISVAEGQLLISGKPEFLRLFANNLPDAASQACSVPYHVHFDRRGLEDRISEASINVVLSVRE